MGLEESDARLQAKIKEVADMIGNTNDDVRSHAARLQGFQRDFGEEVEARIAKQLKKERLRNAAKEMRNPGDVLQADGAARLTKLLSLKADKTDVE